MPHKRYTGVAYLQQMARSGSREHVAQIMGLMLTVGGSGERCTHFTKEIPDTENKWLNEAQETSL